MQHDTCFYPLPEGKEEKWHIWDEKQAARQISTPFRPCFRQCSMTTKNCCKGGQSESRVRPKLKADSMSPLMLSLAMFNKFALSTAVGSFTAKTEKKNVTVCSSFRNDTKK